MSAARIVRRAAASMWVLLAMSQQSALALPTMIRLGYSECSACHISPQGGGPLNVYGRGIDRAQSLRGGEYKPSTDDLARVLSLGGRTTQDVRIVFQERVSQVSGTPSQTQFWPRFAYRNATEVGGGFRVSATITGETDSMLRPARTYEPPSTASSIFVNTALLHYRARPNLEFAAGRDQLPTGVNVPDLGLWTRSRNRLGYYDAPTQLKMFWNGQRVHVAPFVYASATNEPSGERETGAGSLAEVVVGGSQRTVLGVSALTASARDGDRRTIGAYARLGFGQWGLLLEHDVTNRTRVVPAAVSFAQHASYGQLFWAIREWFVASLIAERLTVANPYEEDVNAAKLEFAARLASQATLAISARRQQDQITGRVTNSLLLQAAFKTVR
jgi:hypothetical protein